MNYLALDKSLRMFSIEHIIAVIVTLSIVLVVFLFRNFFIKNKKADLIFRIIIAFLLIYSEFQLRFNSTFNRAPIILRNIPLPLCGMLLWINSIALLGNSERIMRKFYPLFLTGAFLSLIFCDIEGANFPDFRAFQYFICHGGFLLGALYFVFTRRINKFNFKDFGWSCLIIGMLGAVMSVLFATNPNIFPDDFYVMGFGMELFKPIREACGQIGYSLIYMSSITLIMFIITLVTYLCTKNRDDNEYKISYKDNAFLNFYSYKITKNGRNAILYSTICGTMYLIAWQAVMSGMGLDGKTPPTCVHDPLIVTMAWIIAILWFVILGIAIINEMAYYYTLERNK